MAPASLLGRIGKFLTKPDPFHYGGPKYDRLFTILCVCSALGLFFDVYAHQHLLVRNEDLATPWHFAMYGSSLGIALFLTLTLLKNKRAGGRPGAVPPTEGGFLKQRQDLAKWLPIGYDVTYVGILLYGAYGALDITWHLIFRIENNPEAFFSPTHLGLLIGAAMFRSSPLRSAWLAGSPSDRGWRDLWPAMASAGCLLFSLMVFTMYVSPFGLLASGHRYPPAGQELTDAGNMSVLLDWIFVTGVTGALLYTAIVMSFVLLLVDRWSDRLPRGTFAVLLAVTTLGVTVIREQFLATPAGMPPGPLVLTGVAFLGGAFADILRGRLHPTAQTPWMFRAFAFAVPVFLFACYIGAMWVFFEGVWWTRYVWIGMILIPGAIGVAISFLVVQPPAHLVATGRAAVT
jgi:hypothetical protein